jgi:hypothetical protein
VPNDPRIFKEARDVTSVTKPVYNVYDPTGHLWKRITFDEAICGEGAGTQVARGQRGDHDRGRRTGIECQPRPRRERVVGQ